MLSWLYDKLKKPQKKGLKYGELQRDLAEALLWLEEAPSCAAIPSKIEDQPARQLYYDDAEYLLDFLESKREEREQR